MEQCVSIPRQLVTQLLQHAQSREQTEVCGLISARHGQAARCYPISNIAATPHSRYIMDPKEQIGAMRHMRDNDETLFAIYHSHPGSPARPSDTDIAEAGYPDALYLIISLDTKGVLDMRGFRLKEDRVSEVALAL